MGSPVVLIGAGGHAIVVAYILRLQGRKILGFLDDDHNAVCSDLLRLGSIKDAMEFSSKAEFIISIGSNQIRKRIAETEGANLKFATAIHPDAVISDCASLQQGTVIMAGVVINPGTRVGKHCIVNTSSCIDHDCVLDNYVHVSPGTTIAGTVHIGQNVWLGAGSTIVNNINICHDVIVGAGSLVIRDIKVSGVYVGVPSILLKKSLSPTKTI